MNREIYPKVKIIMNNSIKEAKAFDDVKVKPEHILLSILSDNDNTCVNILKKLKVEPSDLYDLIYTFVRVNDLIPRVSKNRRSLPFSDESKAIINSLDKECDKLGDIMIDTTHIMLAMLNSKYPISKFLIDMGITYDIFLISMVGEDYKPEQIKSALEESSDELDSFNGKSKQGEPKSKTPVLDNFCRDISKAVERGELDPVVGRAPEIKRISQILSRRKKNNPVLIGEPGVGKCICPDTEVVMRNDLTGEVFKTTITNLLNTFTNS